MQGRQQHDRDQLQGKPCSTMPTMRIVCVLLVIWASGRSYGQRIVRGPEDVTALFMRSTTFSCIFDAYLGSSYHVWVTPLYEVVDAVSIGQQTKNYVLNYDYAANNFTLTILNVTLQDQGVYECQLASVATTRATLKVVAFPQVVMSTSPLDTKVTEGNELNVTCTTRGAYPPATIAWFVDAERTPTVTIASGPSPPSPYFSGVNDTASILSMKPTRGDSGQLVLCQACIREEYCVNQSVTLRVCYAPNVSAVVLPNSGSITEGNTLTVSCQADSYPLVTSWRWYVNQIELSFAQNQTSIAVPSISQAYDKQEITCTATNDVGSGNWSTRISVVAAPTSGAIVAGVELDLGQAASFSCGPAIEAGPLLSVVWLKSSTGAGARVVSTSSNLTLPAVTEGDAGSYTCMTSAPGGNLTVVRSLNVQLKQGDAPWLYPVIGVGSGLAVVIIVIVVVVCCLKRQTECKKSEGTSSIMSGTTENSIQKQGTEIYLDHDSPRCDDRSSAGTPWEPMSDCNRDAFSRLDYLPLQLKSTGPGCSPSTAGTELCFQDALVYPTFTNNYLQFPECYKATVHMRAIPPPPPFNFYCTSDTSVAAVGVVAGTDSSWCSECDSPTSAAAGEAGVPAAAVLHDRLRTPAVDFAETTGTMRSVRQYAVSAVTECQLATNV